MFGTLKTLMMGASARAEETVRDAYAIELIDQKIREAEASLQAGKATLASLIQRQRSEARQKEALENRVAVMTTRAREALEAKRKELAQEAAEAIAQMENELTLRRATLERLDNQVLRLRASVEAGHRRIIDLKQGAITAKAIRREQTIQSRLNTTIGNTSAAHEAEELIRRVVGGDDPLEQSQILSEIDSGLNHDSLDDKLADQGFGPASRTTAADILARLSAN